MSLYCSQCGVANAPFDAKCKSCAATLVSPSKNSPVKAEIVDESNSESPWPSGALLSIVIAVLCVIYIVNPTAGILEFLPDNIPIIGNLDEATATAGLLYALSELGVIPWKKKRKN